MSLDDFRIRSLSSLLKYNSGAQSNIPNNVKRSIPRLKDESIVRHFKAFKRIGYLWLLSNFGVYF